MKRVVIELAEEMFDLSPEEDPPGADVYLEGSESGNSTHGVIIEWQETT